MPLKDNDKKWPTIGFSQRVYGALLTRNVIQQISSKDPK